MDMGRLDVVSSQHDKESCSAGQRSLWCHGGRQPVGSHRSILISSNCNVEIFAQAQLPELVVLAAFQVSDHA